MTNKKYRRPLTAQAVKLRLQKFAANLVLAILLLGLCFLILQPLFNKIAVSFMSEQDLYDSTVVTIPRHFTLDNYRVALKLMDYGRALDDIQKALELDPQYVKAYMRRGNIEFALKQYHRAKRSFARGLEIDEKDAGCQEGLEKTVRKIFEVSVGDAREV